MSRLNDVKAVGNLGVFHIYISIYIFDLFRDGCPSMEVVFHAVEAFAFVPFD